MAYTYVPISTTSLVSNNSNISFTNISQSYTDLKIAISGKSTRNATNAEFFIKFNGTTTNYTAKRLYASGGTSSIGSTNHTDGLIGVLSAAGNTYAGAYANSFIYIPNYTSSVAKAYQAESGYTDNTTTANIYNYYIVGLWNNNSAITQIDLYPEGGTSWVSGSTFTLYGVLKS